MQISLKIMKTSLKVAFLLTFLQLLIPSVQALSNTTDTVVVNVSVNATAEIVVSPINFTWANLNPGETDGTTHDFTIKNTGSYNVSKIRVSVNTPTVESTNPLPTGDAVKYAASGFLHIQNYTTTTPFYIAGRLEWNLSEKLADENWDLTDITKFGHGWYRNRTETFLWIVKNGSTGFCNSTTATFKIMNEPENATHENRDLVSGPTTSCNPTWNDDEWGIGSCSGGPLNNYCVAAHVNCTKIYIYKYDTDFGTCTNGAYWREDILVPGTSTKGKVYASIPWGVPNGNTTDSVMTFTASFTIP